jgi:hypothetical protein
MSLCPEIQVRTSIDFFTFPVSPWVALHRFGRAFLIRAQIQESTVKFLSGSNYSAFNVEVANQESRCSHPRNFLLIGEPITVMKNATMWLLVKHK